AELVPGLRTGIRSDFVSRSPTPVWERGFAKLLRFAGRRETEFPTEALPNRSLGTRKPLKPSTSRLLTRCTGSWGEAGAAAGRDEHCMFPPWPRQRRSIYVADRHPESHRGGHRRRAPGHGRPADTAAASAPPARRPVEPGITRGPLPAGLRCDEYRQQR